MGKLPGLAGCLLAFAASAAAAQTASSPQIGLSVDLTDAPRKIIHATETIAVTPGPLTLVYPKWIPGEHMPDGPIENLAGLVFTPLAGGQPCGDTASSALPWQRDKVDMFAFHLNVPAGCTSLTIHLDYLATAPESGFSTGASTSANLAVLAWNTVVLYPAATNAADITVTPSVTLPSAWQFATALHRVAAPASASASYNASFDPVTLEHLIDSPLMAGKYFKEVALAPDITPRHFLDMAGDGPEDLDLAPEHIAQLSQLVREASALYRSHHYGEYHFLVTLSDSVAHFGLEHHESSDDRLSAHAFTDDDAFVLAGDLLPHEFTHSWNGKYRRPADLATSNYQLPMQDDLLWVYEGLTQYLGDVLATRCGIWTPEQYRGMLADKAAMLDYWPGRTWRNLQDTATAAQILYDVSGGWDNWRRKPDFYSEGELIWLDVDTTIRKLTDGRKSLDDFIAAFEGLDGNTPPRVVPYTFDDVVAGLNNVAPNDWAAFLRRRLDTNQPHAPLGGIQNGGYALTYAPRPNLWSEKEYNTNDATTAFWFSLGLRVNANGFISDVLKGSPADKSELGPDMNIIAVNSRAFTPSLLRAAVDDAEGPGAPPVELIVENQGYFRTLRLDYHGGEQYPQLERVNGVPDTLDQILAPLARQPH